MSLLSVYISLSISLPLYLLPISGPGNEDILTPNQLYQMSTEGARHSLRNLVNLPTYCIIYVH